MQAFKILSIVTLTIIAISTSSCNPADSENSKVSSLSKHFGIEPIKLTEAEKKIIQENIKTLKETNKCLRCDLRGMEDGGGRAQLH